MEKGLTCAHSDTQAPFLFSGIALWVFDSDRVYQNTRRFMLQKHTKNRLCLRPVSMEVSLLHLHCPRLRRLPKLCQLRVLRQKKEPPQLASLCTCSLRPSSLSGPWAHHGDLHQSERRVPASSSVSLLLAPHRLLPPPRCVLVLGHPLVLLPLRVGEAQWQEACLPSWPRRQHQRRSKS